MKKIITEHLCLRKLLVSDITRDYINSLNDLEVIRLTETKYEKWTMPKVKKYVIKSNEPGKSLLTGIFLKETDKHIGNIRLFNFNEHHRRAELGIMIFDKSQWSKGYGTESLGAFTKYAFERFSLHKICADYYSPNKASARIFEKSGFKTEGIFKDHFLLDGKYVDSIRIAKFD